MFLKVNNKKKQGGCSPPITLKHKIPGYDYFENFDVQRRTRPPSFQRCPHILNSCHKEVVHVCLIQNIPESEPCSEEDESSFKCLYLIKQKLIMS